ncbi:conserved exported hypothetical protein [Nitrospina gracilis 3/211]|uniref:Lipoprotein n=1 Tax=Nitrospina gracilis (strain 3/211) TaxID=1266370 RepID=M1Z037_NITG3|nr:MULTISPECIES: hypothetical protein [Nitrospina]MCF8723970.1 hypothetical protein [Nitrospina sp. Nb-3]CCQ91094.1 conserved exported hypothetical protein [Nitrospina gracilis 3/211]
MKAKARQLIWLSVIPFVLLLSSCTSLYKSTETISKSAYESGSDSMGVVLLSVNWGRRWGCGSFENAQLHSFGFDLLPPQTSDDATPPGLVLNNPSPLTSRPVFNNYSFLLPPGEYGLTYLKIKVAKSVSEVGAFTAKRSDNIENGQSRIGSFQVKAGETVYIGNFGVDCAHQPIIWRYFTKGKEDFQKHLDEFSNEYPYLNLDRVSYRLFQTEQFGLNYSLNP